MGSDVGGVMVWAPQQYHLDGWGGGRCEYLRVFCVEEAFFVCGVQI